MQKLLNFLRWAAFILLALIAALAMIENREPVALVFLGWHTAELPVYWWLVTAFALGGVCGWLVSGVGLLRARAGARRARTQLEKTRAEVETLRRPTSGGAG